MNAGARMINKINMVLAFMKLPVSVYWWGQGERWDRYGWLEGVICSGRTERSLVSLRVGSKIDNMARDDREAEKG